MKTRAQIEMRVLYVCTGNSFRSPAAEALTRKFHPEKEVESAGTDSVGCVAENMKKLLEKEDALHYVKPEPDKVSGRALNEADCIVCMMPEHREKLKERYEIDEGKLEVWRVEDPIKPGVEPDESFREIKQKVKKLE